MFSLNVPVPGSVARLASDLHPQLVGFETIREQYTLVVKRFETTDSQPAEPTLQLARLREQLRPVLAGMPAFDAQITEISSFDQPTRGDGPVVYLAVESPGLTQLHNELTAAFGVIDGLEGADYVPHITLARRGPPTAVDQLETRQIEPISWTVSELVIWDSRYREPAARFGLPG